MAKRRAPVPVSDSTGLWRYCAGPGSLLPYEIDRRANVASWTADPAGASCPGDLVLLYGTGRLQRYVAIARVCCVPTQNDKVQRLKRNRDFWIYLEVQPLARSVPRAEVESQPFAKVERSGLKTPAGGTANRVAPSAIEPVLDLLVRDDPTAARRVAEWRDGTSPLPTELDLEELRSADWSRPEVRESAEVALCKTIAEKLVKGSRFRYLRADDGVGRVPARFEEGSSRLSLEHGISDEAGNGRVDIVLVDCEAARPTLVAIEVKLRASRAQNRDPTPQAVRYKAALEARDGDRWSVRPVVVAEHFGPGVTDEAESRGVAWRKCVAGRLTKALD